MGIFFLFLAGFVAGALTDLVFAFFEGRCHHRYGDWEELGVGFQQGKCSKCGKLKVTGR